VQIGLDEVILEEYANGDGIRMKYNAGIQFII
jgi:hypothetical protein